jgi:hypothetical protein
MAKAILHYQPQAISRVQLQDMRRRHRRQIEPKDLFLKYEILVKLYLEFQIHRLSRVSILKT